MTGGRWFIDSKSHPDLFSIAYNPSVYTAARLLVSDAFRLPEAGAGVSATVHYYDRYQLDGNDRPLARSAESRDLYGASPSDTEFIALLSPTCCIARRTRPGSTTGCMPWATCISRASRVLVFFSEGAENRAQVIGAIQDGIAFLPWE